MIELNKFYNEDCLETIKKINGKFINCVLTSPPYNMTKRKGGYADKQARYDTYNDWKSEGEYIKLTLDIFKSFDKVLKPNGVVIYYSEENGFMDGDTLKSLNGNDIS